MGSIELNRKQRAALRRMMIAVVERDPAAVAELLDGGSPRKSSAASASNFWMWADNYAGKQLNLILPPGGVKDWPVSGVPLRDDPDVLALNIDVWSDEGLTDLTIEFDLVPDDDGYRVKLRDMHVL